MQTILVYQDEELGDAWKTLFSGLAGVEIIRRDITDVACDAIVSPANSFGFMDGGLDLALSERFGWGLQSAVQAAIQGSPQGELLVGNAIVTATGDSTVPWLVVAPTMRVPMSFGIATSVNAYLAMKAILIAAKSHGSIDHVAIPGLCTGVGRMPAQVSAAQMYRAYDEVIHANRPSFADFGEAQKHQLELNPNGLIWDF